MGTKVAFQMNKDMEQRIESLMTDCQVDSKKELLNNAISLLEWAITQKKEGFLIGKLNPTVDEFGELKMPVIDNIK